MRVGRFTRRAGLRAGLSAGAASPLGREAAAVAAAVGAAQEQPLVGATLGAGAVALVVHCWRSARPWSLRSTARPSARPWSLRHPTARPSVRSWLLRSTARPSARSWPLRSTARPWSLRHPTVRRDASLVAARVAAGAAIGLGTRFVWSVAPKEPAAVAPHRTWRGLDPAPDGAGIGIVVNPGAGSGRAGASDPAAELASALPRAEIVVPDEPSEIPDQLRKLAASGVRALGIAGGDGSINTAAGIAIENDLPLVVVPAGTLNHLARDLGVETVDDAIDAVRAGHAIEIDVARIAGRPFLNTASFGSYVEIVDARENLERQIGKWPALLVALVRVLRRGTPVDVVVDGEPHRLWIVFVGNCRYEPDGMAPTWRERLDDGQLDVRVADAATPLARLRLVAAVLTGRVSRSPVFRTWCTTNMRVESTDGPLRLARDGETFDGPGAFDIAKNGDRLAVYTPNRELP